MEHRTLERIERLILQADGRHMLAEHTPAIILDDKIVTIEHLKKGRSRFRGAFSTSVLSEYVDYLRRHPGGVGFIDPKRATAKAFLNLGDSNAPGHADWTATLSLEPTAAYAALTAIEGEPQSQRDLVEWIEDWHDNLNAVRGDEVVPITKAVASIRELTIEAKKSTTTTDRDFGASRSAMEDIEARARDGMPSHLMFRTSPYLGLSERVFRLRISVLAGGDNPKLVLRTVGREQAVEDIAIEFRELLLREIGDAATMSIGSFTP